MNIFKLFFIFIFYIYSQSSFSQTSIGTYCLNTSFSRVTNHTYRFEVVSIGENSYQLIGKAPVLNNGEVEVLSGVARLFNNRITLNFKSTNFTTHDSDSNIDKLMEVVETSLHASIPYPLSRLMVGNYLLKETYFIDKVGHTTRSGSAWLNSCE